MDGGVDVEYLTMYVISLLKSIDIRSEPAIRLLADFLDPHSTQNAAATAAAAKPGASAGGASGEGRTDVPDFPNGAEHFGHELYSFLRSPFKELRKWDEVAQVSLPVHCKIES